MRFSRRRNDLACRRAVALIADYLDGALPPAERSDLERHLSACPHCAEYLAQLRATIAATGRIDTDELRPEVRQALIGLYRRSRTQDHR